MDDEEWNNLVESSYEQKHSSAFSRFSSLGDKGTIAIFGGGALVLILAAIVFTNTEYNPDTSEYETSETESEPYEIKPLEYYVRVDHVVPVAKTEDELEIIVRCATQNDTDCMRDHTWFYLQPGMVVTMLDHGFTVMKIRHRKSGFEGYVLAEFIGSR